MIQNPLGIQARLDRLEEKCAENDKDIDNFKEVNAKNEEQLDKLHEANSKNEKIINHYQVLKTELQYLYYTQNNF